MFPFFSIVLFTSLLILIGCKNPADGITADSGSRLARDILRQVNNDLRQDPTSLYSTDSTITGNTPVLLMAQGTGKGGPDEHLNTSSAVVPRAPSGEYVRVWVKQKHMEEGILPRDRVITPGEAGKINLYSAAVLFALAEYFQSRNHEVGVYGESFGALLINETLRRYGHEPFTRIFILGGRIDMPGQWAEDRSGGRRTFFYNSAEGPRLVRIQCRNTGGYIPPSTPPYYRRRSKMRLQADLAANRYSLLIPEESLSKITFYSGGKSYIMGSLTEDEVYFLTGKRVNLQTIADGRYESKIVRTRSILSFPKTIDFVSGKYCETLLGGGRNARIYTIKGISGKYADVKYTPRDNGRGFWLRTEIRGDILSHFNPPSGG